MVRIYATPRFALAALASLALAAPAAHAAFPGTNGEIAFERNGEVHLMQPDGSGATPLAQGLGDSFYSTTAVSPDGTRVAYVAQNGIDESFDIWTVRYDGGGKVNLSDVAGGIAGDFDPAWSPDGSKIAFQSSNDGTPDIWVMNADGTNRTQVTAGGSGAFYYQPAWSPDGTKIAFTVGNNVMTHYVPPYVASKGLTQALSDPPTPVISDGSNPNWAPDGSRIAFQRGSFGSRDVYVAPYPPNQSSPVPPQRVTFQNDSFGPVFDDHSPAFSPDGLRLLFVSDRYDPDLASSGVYAIYSADPTAEETGVTQMTSPAPPEDLAPDWGPLRAVAPADPPPPPPPPVAQCSDGLDNDGDGQTDLSDPGCANAADNDETNAAVVEQLSPPERGKTANAEPVNGEVFVKLPPGAAQKAKYRWAQSAGGDPGVPKGFIRLSEAKQLPVGTMFDTRRGMVRLTTARDAFGSQTQQGNFSRGRFDWRQSTKRPLTTLTMRGGGLNRCKAKSASGDVSAAARRRRSIFGSGSGRFRTRGRRSTATVRGTKWLQKDTCRGTLTVVREGSVVVRDLAKRKPIVLKANGRRQDRRHFARAPRR